MNCYYCNSRRLKYQKERDSYVCLKCGHDFPKQYFFISHSHLDIEKVRVIRNIIEETFFYEPILFFLKCLSDDEEIKDLIEREIFERIWFVYCDSPNARKSKYVQAELAYISSLVQRGYDKKVLVIDLGQFEIWNKGCRERLRNQISHQIRKTKIFLSYSRRDGMIADQLYHAFQEQGYSVWMDAFMQAQDTENWAAAMGDRLRQHSYKDGVVLAIFSEESKHSPEVLRETEMALQHGALVVPVLVKGREGYLPLPDIFRDRQYVVWDSESPEESLRRLLEYLRRL